ncbi:MAG: hypothetical protein ACI4HQ_06595 [Acetatifactor sp.]
MNYESLLEEANKNDIYVIEHANFKSKSDGLINGSVIGINLNVRSSRKRARILEEKLGHYHTTSGDIIFSSAENQKQELLARVWAYDRMVGLLGIVRCYQSCCRNRYEMAELLDVTEDFLQEALDYYSGKYGEYAVIDNYVICFQPLTVLELR